MNGAVLVLVEPEEGRLGLVSRESLTFARRLGGAVQALVLGAVDEAVLADCREHGAEVVHEATDEELGRSYAAAAWATALERCLEATEAAVVLGGGTPRGNEVIAHVAARRDLPMAANVVEVVSAEPLEVERQVAGGTVLERMRLDAVPALLTVAGHAVDAAPAPTPGAAHRRPFSAGVAAKDLRARVSRTSARAEGDSSELAAARVVIGVGRGAGGVEGFAEAERLAARLGGTVGVSRVVTGLGWRPHHEQIGQSGTRISPDVYIACGISGAVQHWAGCSSARTIIAINIDEQAPMVTRADYAVIGDMHEVLAAVLDELG
jgi:electron transfer flavoprotein alpha subunit